MKHSTLTLATAACMLAATALVASSAYSQPVPAAYPAKGQSPAKQAKDEGECSAWATKQTGYDPAHPPVVTQAKPTPVTGSGARVRGAAMGAAVGGIAGNDVGDAAVRGAVVGGVAQRVRNRRAATQANQANQAQVQASANGWAQARSACLSGRGYTTR